MIGYGVCFIAVRSQPSHTLYTDTMPFLPYACLVYVFGFDDEYDGLFHMYSRFN